MAQINKPNTYFNTVLYTGNGSTLSISSLEFSPDLVWIKNRDVVSNNVLFDTVRGVTLSLESESTVGDTVRSGITSFDSNGFTLGSNANSNANGNSHASWNWRGSDSSAVTNNDGSITSTVSANTTAGFSIVSWTGTGSGSTIGHGLGVKPKMIIVKNRSSVTNWVVNVGEIIGTDERSLYLNSTDAIKNDAQAVNGYTYNNTTTTFSTANGSNGNQNDVNQSGNNIIAYCFAEKKGFSKFGKYTGNGSTDGTFVYTGFKPAWVMVKRTDSINDWKIIDNKRATFNIAGKTLKANASDAEDGTENYYDFCSNGYKIRNSAGALNASGGSYIYMAFASEPLVSTAGVPCTAR